MKENSPLPPPGGTVCPNCGAAQSSSAPYCTNCGMELTSKKPALKTPFWKGVLTVFLGLGALAFGAFGSCITLLTVTRMMNGSLRWQGLLALAIAYGLWWCIQRINRKS